MRIFPLLRTVVGGGALVTDAPHRHSANRGPRPLVSILLPLTSVNSTRLPPDTGRWAGC
jgi:hypothetical protein